MEDVDGEEREGRGNVMDGCGKDDNAFTGVCFHWCDESE